MSVTFGWAPQTDGAGSFDHFDGSQGTWTDLAPHTSAYFLNLFPDAAHAHYWFVFGESTIPAPDWEGPVPKQSYGARIAAWKASGADTLNNDALVFEQYLIGPGGAQVSGATLLGTAVAPLSSVVATGPPPAGTPMDDNSPWVEASWDTGSFAVNGNITFGNQYYVHIYLVSGNPLGAGRLLTPWLNGLGTYGATFTDGAGILLPTPDDIAHPSFHGTFTVQFRWNSPVPNPVSVIASRSYGQVIG